MVVEYSPWAEAEPVVVVVVRTEPMEPHNYLKVAGDKSEWLEVIGQCFVLGEQWCFVLRKWRAERWYLQMIK